jgi:hypothetical protein
MNRYITILLLFLFQPLALATEGTCPNAEMISEPTPVNILDLQEKIARLSSSSEKNALAVTPEFNQQIAAVFDVTKIKTKMEQFYTMLWVIGQKFTQQHIQTISLTKSSVEDVLLASKVFTDPAIPKQIQTIEFDVSDAAKPKYSVTFGNPHIEVPLNQGNGFYLFRNGKCQHAQKLIFDQNFTFEMKKNLGNLMVNNFKGVDLFGDFGNRGMIDVDIQYVSLRSVEFFTGTPNGRVTAYVSREEFSKNNHNALLELVTRIVPDRSVQPIDW